MTTKVKRFVITCKNEKGLRILAFAQLGRYTYATRAEADEMLAAIREESPSVIRDSNHPNSWRVDEVDCYPDHFDPVRSVFGLDDASDDPRRPRVTVFDEGTKDEHRSKFVHPFSEAIDVGDPVSDGVRLRVGVVGNDDKPITSMQFTCSVGNASTTIHISTGDARKSAAMLLEACEAIDEYNREQRKNR